MLTVLGGFFIGVLIGYVIGVNSEGHRWRKCAGKEDRVQSGDSLYKVIKAESIKIR